MNEIKEYTEKLFEDILQAHELDRYHFTGSVVYSLLKTENKIDYYVIIDGQQRLTTLFLLHWYAAKKENI